MKPGHRTAARCSNAAWPWPGQTCNTPSNFRPPFGRRPMTPRHRQEIALLAARKELQGNLQQSRDAATMASKELEATGTTDPSERLKFLNEQLAAAEARRLERQNSLSAAAENSSRLKQRLEALQAQVARIINDSQRLLRLPLERETGKRPLFVIVEYGARVPVPQRRPKPERKHHQLGFER